MTDGEIYFTAHHIGFLVINVHSPLRYHFQWTPCFRYRQRTREMIRSEHWRSSVALLMHIACKESPFVLPPQWGAADAEIKVPSGENTELRRSPFKAFSRSVYSHTCYTYCQGFFPCLFLPFWSIHLHFFQNLSQFCVCWLWLIHGSCVGPQNKLGEPAGCRFPWWVPVEYQ